MWSTNDKIPRCDDESTHDPDTGWGGFTDHRAKKHFRDEAEQDVWYAERKKRGLPDSRSSWDDDEA